MLHWLSRWGRRFGRACCYPFQFRRLHNVRPEATIDALDEPDSRDFPRSRVEAIRQGILVPPKGESLLDGLALDEPGAGLDLEEALMLSVEDSGERITDAPFFGLGTLEPNEPLRSPTSAKTDSSAKRRDKFSAAQLPFDWVLEERLAIGAFPCDGWEQDLEQQGIYAIISLCDESEENLPEAIAEQFRCLRVPLPDSCYRRSLTVDELGDAVDLIHWHVQKKRPVYLHCLAGIERSPLVAIAYLARYCSMELLDAVCWISHVHSRSRPIPAQLQVVGEYLQRADANGS